MSDSSTINKLFNQWLEAHNQNMALSADFLCIEKPDLKPALELLINAHLANTNSIPPETRTSGEFKPFEISTGTTLFKKDNDEKISNVLLTPPCDFGPYKIEKKLGEGGMGAVFLAHEVHLKRDVALKVMLPRISASGESKDRFLNEARAMATVEHDHVVPIYRADEIDGIPFLAMPLLRGESLETRLKREKNLPPTEVIRIGSEMARGLWAAHQKGLIHRDVKSANTWLEAGTGRVKILDFGIAAAAAEMSTGSYGVFGSPPYMSPEQTQGNKIDGRSDLYSLGVTLYEMATGVRPSDRRTAKETMHAIVSETPKPVYELQPDIPSELSALIMKLLDKDPANRPQTAAIVIDELRKIQSGGNQITEKIPAEMRRDKKRIPPWIWLITGIACSTLAAIALFGLLKLANSENKKDTETTNNENSNKSVDNAEIQIKSFIINHFTTTLNGDKPNGELGVDFFKPKLNDKIQISAKISKPGYSFIIGFRADGEIELCYPNDEKTKSPLSDNPRYPMTEENKGYGLDEGTGLCIFGIVTSESPLPTFEEWKKNRSLNWKKETAEPGTMWEFDGKTLTPKFASGVVRGKDKEISGVQTVRSVADWMTYPQGAKVKLLAFGVGPKE